MNLKRKIIILVMVLFFVVSCGTLGIKFSDNSVTVLETATTSSIGYLIAKNNKDYIPKFVEWYADFNEKATTLAGMQSAFKDGLAQLTDLITKEPYLKLQIRTAMDLIEVTADGPQVESDMEKYKKVVDGFMLGVLEAQKT